MSKSKKSNSYKRIILITLIIFLLTFLAFSSFCSFNILKFGQAIIQNDKDLYIKTYQNAGFCIDWFFPFKDFSNALRNKKYIVLLQNNYELRASGGFLGSYAVLHLGDHGLEDWQAKNIYDPDGQLKGHVTPKLPIQQAFRTGDWRLRDSNWEVDFTKAARDIDWFFEKGGEGDIDGIIAINFTLIEDLVNILGDIKINTYGEKIDLNNLYSLTQSSSEEDSFAGSTQKQSFLNELGTNILFNFNEANLLKRLQIVKLMAEHLENGQILIWLKNNDIAQKIRELGWDGSLENYNFDFVFPVESNLGANKVNCCISRNIVHQVTIEGTRSVSDITINFKNNSESSSPNPPLFWGGDYRNYERMVIPIDAKNISLKVNEKEYMIDETKRDVLKLIEPENDLFFTIEDYGNYKIIGFWAITKAKDTTSATLSYELPFEKGKKTYEVVVKPQPGIKGVDYKLIVNGKIKRSVFLRKQRIFKVRFKLI
jgi:hypothetical protein